MKAETSSSKPLRVDWFEQGIFPRGRVGMTFAPGKKGPSTHGFDWNRDLPTDLDSLLEKGCAVLVSLVEDHELAEFRIADLFDQARARGIEVLRLPIVDGSVPRDHESVDRLLEQIGTRLAQDKGVVIHCVGGLGRTGTIAGCLLVNHGFEPKRALAMCADTRHDARCPENGLQRSFVIEHAVIAAR